MRDPTVHHSVVAPSWDEKLATGLADIDAQHKRLFAIADAIYALSEQGASIGEIIIAFGNFQLQTAAHFDNEEKLMQQHAVSPKHQRSHLKAHHDFLEHTHRVVGVLETDLNVPVKLLIEFLIKWMKLHVSSADAIMAKEIHAILAGKRPDTDSAEHIEGEDLLTDSIEDLYANLGDKTIEILELNLQLQQEIGKRKRAEKDFSLSQLWLRAVADQVHSWEYWQGTEKEIIYMSPSCEQITGYTVAEFIANPDLLNQIIHQDDRHLMDIHLHYVAQHQEDDTELDFRIVRADGEVRWIAHSCKAIYGKNGLFLGRRGSRRDRTERYREEESLRMAVTVFDVVNEAVMVTNRHNRIVAVNPSFTAITGYQADEVIGQDPRMLSDGGAQPDLLKDLWRTLVRTGCWQGEVTNLRKNGELYTSWISVNSVRDDAGHVTSFVCVFSDITERKENEKRIHYLAHYDLVTSLPNRALFNDRFGHDVGDFLLREVAMRIKGCVRESDTAARIGGDEFVVLLPGTNSKENVMAVAHKILQEIELPFIIDEHQITISASIGIALYPEHGDDVRKIMKHADHAMYRAKLGDGSSVVSFSDLMH